MMRKCSQVNVKCQAFHFWETFLNNELNIAIGTADQRVDFFAKVAVSKNQLDQAYFGPSMTQGGGVVLPPSLFLFS